MEFALTGGELTMLIGGLLLVGLATGVLAGLLGIGGGGILVPALYEAFAVMGVDADVRMHLAVGTALTVIIPTSLRSLASHRAKNAVDFELVKSMALPVVIGVLIGALVARASSDAVLKWVWVCMAVVLSAKLFLGRESWRLGDEIPGSPFRSLYGGFIGVVSTLMSIGGGVFVTMMMTLYGRTMHQAVGTSSAFGPLIAIPGALGFIWAGWHVVNLPPGSVGFVSLIGAAVIIPASVLAAPIGVRLSHSFSRRQLELAFGTFLLIVGSRFLYNLIG